MSILFGLGRGFSLISIVTNCGGLSTKENSGKNFGILFSIWTMKEIFIDLLVRGKYNIAKDFIESGVFSPINFL